MIERETELPTGVFLCESPEETFALGESFGAALRGGEVVLLAGGLGAGKTLFVKGALAALGFDTAEVTSPSFTLVNFYEARLSVYHLDLYRLEGAAAAFAVDLDEILEKPNCVVFVEWAERLENFRLPENIIEIDIHGDGDDVRQIKIVQK